MLLTSSKILVKTPRSAKLPNYAVKQTSISVQFQFEFIFAWSCSGSGWQLLTLFFGNPNPHRLGSWSPLEKSSSILLLCPALDPSHPPHVSPVSSCLPKARKAKQKLQGRAAKGVVEALRVYPQHIGKCLGPSRRATQTCSASLCGCRRLWECHGEVEDGRETPQKPTTVRGCSHADGISAVGSKISADCDSEPVTCWVHFPPGFQYNCHYWVSSDSRWGKKFQFGFCSVPGYNKTSSPWQCRNRHFSPPVHQNTIISLQVTS